MTAPSNATLQTISDLDALIDAPMHDDVRTHLQNYRDLLIVLNATNGTDNDEVIEEIAMREALAVGIDPHLVGSEDYPYSFSDLLVLTAPGVAAALTMQGQ